MRKPAAILLIVGTVAGLWLAFPWVRDSLDPNFIRGTVRDTDVREGYVILYFSKNTPRNGVAIPVAEFRQDLVLALASKDGGTAVGGILNLGSKYKGETITAKGKMAKQDDGSRLVIVESLREVRFVE